MSIITKEAFERCKNKTLAEQLEQVRIDMRNEFKTVYKDIQNLTLQMHRNGERLNALEIKP